MGVCPLLRDGRSARQLWTDPRIESSDWIHQLVFLRVTCQLRRKRAAGRILKRQLRV